MSGNSISCGRCGQGSALCQPDGSLGPCDDPDARLGEPCDPANPCGGVLACGAVCDTSTLCPAGETRDAGLRCSLPVYQRCEPSVCLYDGAGFLLKADVSFSMGTAQAQVQLNTSQPDLDAAVVFNQVENNTVIGYTAQSKPGVVYAFSPSTYTTPGTFLMIAAGWVNKVDNNAEGIDLRVCLYDDGGAIVEIDGQPVCKTGRFHGGPWSLALGGIQLDARCSDSARVKVGVDKIVGPGTVDNADGVVGIYAYSLICTAGLCKADSDLSGY